MDTVPLADFLTNATAGLAFEILTNDHPGTSTSNVTYGGTLSLVAGHSNGPLVLKNTEAWVVISDRTQLDSYLHADVRGLGLTVAVGVPALAPANILYELTETGENTSSFVNDFVMLVAQFSSQPTNTVADQTTVRYFRLGGLWQTNTLTETATNSLLFSGASGAVLLQLPGQPAWSAVELDGLAANFTATTVTLTNYPFYAYETGTNTLEFTTLDNCFIFDERHGSYFGANYSGGACTLIAASSSGILNLHFAQFEGPAGVLAQLAEDSNGTIVQGVDGKYYLANSDQQPAVIIGLDTPPHEAIDCKGTVLEGFVRGVAGGVKALVWDSWFDLGSNVANKYVLPAIDLGFDLYSVATGTMKIQDVAETLKARAKEELPVAEVLGDYMLGHLGATNADFQTLTKVFLDTGARTFTEKLRKKSDSVQQALAAGSTLLKKLWNDLENGCPERRAQIIGRATFEVISFYAAFAKAGQVARAGELSKMTEAEMLAKVAQQSTLPEARQAAGALLAQRAGGVGGWVKIEEVVGHPSVIKQLTPNACGPACAQMILKDAGIEVHQAKLAQVYGKRIRIDINGIERGVASTAEEMKNALNAYHPTGNWKWKWFSGNIDTHIASLNGSSGGSWMAMMDQPSSIKHWVLVDGVDGVGRLIIRDPSGSMYFMTKHEFKSIWNGVAVY